MQPFEMLKFLKILLQNGLKLYLPAVWFLMGHYIKISDSKYICFFLKSYCAVLFFYLTISHVLNNSLYNTTNGAALDFAVKTSYSFIFSQEPLIKFYNGIRTSDAVMGFKNLPFINEYIYAFVALVISLRVFVVYYRLARFLGYPTFIMSVSSEVTCVIVFLIFFSLYTRIKLIRKSLENNFVSVNIVGKDQVDKNVNVVRKCMGYYKNLLDNMDIIDNQLQILVSTSLICNIPKCVAAIYFSIKMYILFPDMGADVGLVTELSSSLILVTSSAFITEMISSEVDEIKATLVTQLIRCSDQSLQFELEIALQYVHMRPFEFVIFRAVSVNISLPFGVVSMCISGVIIGIQFSHYIGY